MRTTLTILRLLRSAMCVGACLLWTVPVYAVDTLQVTTREPLSEEWGWTAFSFLGHLGSQFIPFALGIL